MPVLQEIIEEIIKRDDGSAQQVPTVAIVLLSVLAVILVFGIARVAVQAANKTQTVVGV
jgi:hypothetical protein